MFVSTSVTEGQVTYFKNTETILRRFLHYIIKVNCCAYRIEPMLEDLLNKLEERQTIQISYELLILSIIFSLAVVIILCLTVGELYVKDC